MNIGWQKEGRKGGPYSGHGYRVRVGPNYGKALKAKWPFYGESSQMCYFNGYKNI